MISVAGFVGRYIACTFANQGWSVIGIGSLPPENAPLLNLEAYEQMRLPDQCLNDLLYQYQPQVCIHCAGRASVGLSIGDSVADFYANTASVLEVLSGIRLYAPQCRFISLSSAAAYGDPPSLPVDITQLNVLGFTPAVALKRGVKTFVEWCRAELVGV